MKRILLVAILIIPVFIQACASNLFGRAEDRHDRASAYEPGGYEKNYQLGVKKSAFIGQDIINVKKYNKTILSALSLDRATITARYKFSNIQLMIDKGSTSTLRETINLGEKYYLLHLPTFWKDWRLLISADGGISNKALYSYSDEMVYTPYKEISIEPQNFKLLLKKAYVEPLFSYQLIYTGINDVSLNITYREYTGNDYARPAFYQSLTYNADAKQIRFKEFLIQIHNVTNENITYTVLEDGLR